MNGGMLPAVRMNNELVKMPPIQKLLLFLGYKLEPSLEEDDIMFLMMPPWNFDELLQAILLCLRYLQCKWYIFLIFGSKIDLSAFAISK